MITLGVEEKQKRKKQFSPWLGKKMGQMNQTGQGKGRRRVVFTTTIKETINPSSSTYGVHKSFHVTASLWTFPIQPDPFVQILSNRSLDDAKKLQIQQHNLFALR
jgi:hypothetical protein